MGRIGLPELVILFFITVGSLIVVLPWWRILKRTGNPPALSLLMLIPLVNVGLLFWFAFAEWPIERQLEAFRSQRP
jgi:hypothetical protein